MRHYLLPEPPAKDGSVVLPPGDVRHLVRVRRLGVGDSFPAVDAEGRAWRLTIEALEGDRAVAIAVQTASGQGTHPEIVLFQGIPKAGKMDLIVRQAAEAGVSRVVPFASEFAVGKVDDDAARKTERWNRVAREAIQQSGSLSLTRVEPPIPFRAIRDAFGSDAPNVGLFFHQDASGAASVHSLLAGKTGAIAIVVGPEGGLSDAETGALGSWGYRSAYLGANVLRTETAALYATACVQIILLEKPSWIPKTQQRNA